VTVSRTERHKVL